jgi:hypothetical protein
MILKLKILKYFYNTLHLMKHVYSYDGTNDFHRNFTLLLSNTINNLDSFKWEHALIWFLANNSIYSLIPYLLFISIKIYLHFWISHFFK